jgi:8-oxo-dGTP pyrophosphatase MutT (NUDIX family)
VSLDGKDTESFTVHALAGIEARLVAYDWPFVTDYSDEIAAHWTALKASKPASFNGKVLLQRQGHVDGDIFRAEYFQTDFASFVAWMRGTRPAAPNARIRNGFALSALRSRDGAYLMGVMAGHTVNAGRIYFPGGTPDLGDVTPDGRVDLAGSLLRELEEETGLSPSEITLADGWHALVSHARAAFLREVLIDLPAVEARALILDRLAGQFQAELSDIAIARHARDIDLERMPPFMQVFLRQMLPAD